MNKLIAYIHFIGFIPALYVSRHTVEDGGFANVIFSALFSWGLVITDLLKSLG